MTTFYTVSGDLGLFTGGTIRDLRVMVRHNSPDGVHDPDTGKFYPAILEDIEATANAFSVQLMSTDAVPGLRYTLTLLGKEATGGAWLQQIRNFPLTANADLADLIETADPPITFANEVLAQLEGYRDQIQALFDDGFRGPRGFQGEVSVVATETLSPGTPAEVVDESTSPNEALLRFRIPQGVPGQQGNTGPAGGISNFDAELAVRSLVTGTLAEDGYKLAIVDEQDRAAVLVLSDGTFYAPKTQAGQTLLSDLASSDYAWAIVDANEQVALGVRFDGTVHVPKLSATSLTSVARPDVSIYAPASRGLLVTDSTNTVRPYTSTAGIACWGDSMTEGWPSSAFTSPSTQSWPGVLGSLTGLTVYNGGCAGQSADEIALRQGGLALTVTVSGGSIPASGGVTVVEQQTIAWRLDNPFHEKRNPTTTGVACTIAGVPGRLTRSGSVLTFTRDTSGSAVTVSGATPVVFTLGTQYADWIAIFFAGRNDIGYTSAAGDIPNRVLAADVAMINRLTPRHPRFLVTGPLTSTSEVRGSANFTAVQTIHQRLEALYPNNYPRDTFGRSLWEYLSQRAIYDLGITPTTADLTAMAGGTLPPSIMVSGDSVHYSVATAALVGAWFRDRLTERGWV